MKKFILIALLSVIISPVFAGGVAYINYDKVFENYQYAKAAMREIETKANEIQNYLKQKEAEFNKLESPIQKQKFEATVQAELKTKEAAFNDFRDKREEAVYTKIFAAAEKVRIEKGYDAILDARCVFSGGIDISDLIINVLNNSR